MSAALDTARHVVTSWPTSNLKGHQEQSNIFGAPREADSYKTLYDSIKRIGIEEAIVIRDDGNGYGTILSGHKRHACAVDLKHPEVPVRVHVPFSTYLEEVAYVIRANTERTHMKPGEIAVAMKRLRELSREQGGAKGKTGRPTKENGAAGGTISGKTRDIAADTIGVGRHKAEACETVFSTPGVPEDFKAAVNAGTIKPVPAAAAVRAEVKRQGGAIESPAALSALAQPKAPKVEPPAETHEQRLMREARRYQETFKRLWLAYKEVDAVLTSMPLHTVLGPTEHHEYRRVIHDLAIRAWREVEKIEGQTNAGKQMALTVIPGGK